MSSQCSLFFEEATYTFFIFLSDKWSQSIKCQSESMQSLGSMQFLAIRAVVNEGNISVCSVAVFKFVFQALVSRLAIWCRALSHTIPLTRADETATANRYQCKRQKRERQLCVCMCVCKRERKKETESGKREKKEGDRSSWFLQSLSSPLAHRKLQ